MFKSEIAGVMTSVNRISVRLGKTVQNVNQLTPEIVPTGIWFGVPIGIESFYGREEFLNKLHHILKQAPPSESSVTILSQLKVVSGLGGIGKTQTALKYISKFGHCYDHVIWIQAETKVTIKTSFVQLADDLKVPCKNVEGQPEEFDKIVKSVYKRLCTDKKSTLFVFDNADDFNSDIEHFLPSTVDPEQKHLAILVTSRNQDWSRRFEKFQVLTLDLLTEEETLNFIMKQLEIPDSPEIRDCLETREFIQLMGGLPLALQQSVAYITEKRKLRQIYSFSDYISEFKGTMSHILDFDKIPGSSSTILVTWNVTFEKIKTLDNGPSAIEIIQVLSILYADKIPLTLIQSLFPKLDELEMSSCLTLLEKYFLINRDISETGQPFVRIHRQLQFVIMQNLKSCTMQNTPKVLRNALTKCRVWFKSCNALNNIESVIDHVVKRCRIILKTINLANSADIIINLHQLVDNPFNFIPITGKFLDFMEDFADVLLDAGRYSEALNLFTKIYNNRREILGENHVNTLEMQRLMAIASTEMGKYDEALNFCKDALQTMEIHLGPQHESTLSTKFEEAKVLFRQNNSPESLNLLTKVSGQIRKVLGENHSLTVTTQQMLALAYFHQGQFATAFKLSEQVEKKRLDILGADNLDTLSATHNKATALCELGNIKEAFQLFHRVYKKKKEILGEDHPSTIITLNWIAEVIEDAGKLKEALELKRQVMERRRTVLGIDHPGTKVAEKNFEILAQKIKRYSSPL